MGERVIVLVSEENELPAVRAGLGSLQEQRDVLVVTVSPGIKASDFDPHSVQVCPLSLFVGNEEAVLDLLAKEVFSILDRISGQAWYRSDQLKYHSTLVWDCILPEIALRHVRPIIQAIWAFDTMFSSEQPTEVWVNASARWSCCAPVFSGSGPRWLEYDNLYQILLARVAAKHGVGVRPFSTGWRGKFRYGIGRYLRTPAFRAYKLWHWWRKPDEANEDEPGDLKNLPCVAFLVRARRYAGRILPVAHALKTARSIILVDTPLNMHAQPIALEEPSKFLSGRRLYKASLWTAWKLEFLARRLSRSTRNDLSFLAVAFGDILKRVFETHTSEFDEVVTYIHAGEKLISTYHPKVLVLGNDQAVADQAVVRVCHRENIPTVMIQHGMIGNPPAKRPIVSKYAVMGQQTKEVLARWSAMPAEDIVVTGIPDEVRAVDQEQAVLAFKKSLGPQFDSSRPTVTVITAPLPARYDFVQRALEIVDQLKVNIILKAHPAENADYYRRHFSQAAGGEAINVIKGVDIGTVLAVTDVLVAYDSSTVVVEALNLQIPVVLLDTPIFYNTVEKPCYAPYLKMLQKGELAAPLIAPLLFEAKAREAYIRQQNEFVRRLVYQSGQSATENVSEILLQMIASAAG